MTQDTVDPPLPMPDDEFDDRQLFGDSEVDKLKAQVEELREKWIDVRMKYLKSRCLVGERERILNTIVEILGLYSSESSFWKLKAAISGALKTRTVLGDYMTREDVAMLDAEEDSGLIQERLRAINNNDDEK